MSTKITGTITSTVTLGSGLFLSPLTVTGTGLIAPATYGADGIYLPTGRTGISTLVNDGRVFGGNGAYSQYSGGTGGLGVFGYSAMNLVNAGTIDGGNGGNSSPQVGDYSGGRGGTAVFLKTSLASSISNTGLIIGGAGGSGAGFGGAGRGGLVAFGVSIAVSNAGIIRGGAGGSGTYYGGGTGGYGVGAVYGSMLNTGTITGGAGGSSNANNGGGGGYGAFLYSEVLTNTGIITGGAGGNSDNLHGGTGGYGVYMGSGGTLINAGTIGGGAGGYAYYYHTRGAAGGAVFIFGSVASTVVAESGAVFNGAVIAQTLVADVLEVAGTSGAVLSGIGTQFTNFNDIAFAQGAQRGIEGNVAGIGSGQIITGFAAGDTIVLDGFTADFGESQKAGFDLVATTGAFGTLQLGSSLSGDFIGHAANGNTTITTAQSTTGITLKSGFENLTGAGTATGTKVEAYSELAIAYGGTSNSAVIDNGALGGYGHFGLVVAYGGQANHTTFKGGSRGLVGSGSLNDTTLDFGTLFAEAGSTLTGDIKFEGNGNVLFTDGAPSATISGFTSGDKIAFGTPYAAGDKVSVKKAGEVTVNLGGVSLELAVAGAKKGEKDFKLSSGTYGATLSRKGGKAAATNFPAINLPGMTFLTPPQAIHSGGTALPALQSVTASQQKPLAAANPWVASALPPPAPVQDLLRVPHGGIETMLTLQSGL